MRMLFLALLALAGPTVAQGWEPVPEVQADLDGDGRLETYRLLDAGEGSVDLSVTTPNGSFLAPGIAWGWDMAGQRPELALNEAGSVLLTSRNEAVGRDRWRMTLTIVHRGGDWLVGGVTYKWRDTLDPAAYGICDLNLLAGRARVERFDGTREVDLPFEAPRLSDWSAEAPPIPLDLCFED